MDGCLRLQHGEQEGGRVFPNLPWDLPFPTVTYYLVRLLALLLVPFTIQPLSAGQ